MNTITIGVDLAKDVFSSCEIDANGRVQQRNEFRRDAFAAWLVQHRLEMLFGGYFASEYTASLSRKSPGSTGPCSTFVELPPRTLRNCEKYAGRPHALKTSGPSINE